MLAVVLMLAPAAALHPMVAHLYAAGSSNLLIEATHPSVIGFSLAALVSLLPAAGFTVIVVQATRGFAYLRTLMRNSEPARMAEVHYRVLRSDAVVVFTTGLFRPVTFVSSGAERTMRSAELRAALLHEEAHQRSRDVLWRLLLGAVGGGFSFLPRIRDVVDTERLRTECAADDHAIRSGARRVDLFEAIVTASSPPANLLSAGLTDAKAEFRLWRLVHPETPLPSPPTMSFVALTAVVALPALLAHVMVIVAAFASHG
jgi:hypothetical protein